MPPARFTSFPPPSAIRNPEAVLPAGVRCASPASCRYFIVENAKSARAELKRIGLSRPIQEIDIRELPREPNQPISTTLLAPLSAGKSAGLMSEAGAPAVADPGAALVHAAHARGIRRGTAGRALQPAAGADGLRA
jgi:16S rRNA (cytidine1402-2'-O)-methyltransferase